MVRPTVNDITIRLAAVVSLDGKIKQRTPVHTRDWVSPEDKQLYDDLVSWSQVVIAGRKTYQNMRPAMTPATQYLIYTRNPENFGDVSVDDHVRFTSDAPETIVEALKQRGISRILVTGGTQIYRLFLQAGLVHEIYLTIEPIVFGSGKSFVSKTELNLPFALVECRQLNDRGTMLLKYHTE